MYEKETMIGCIIGMLGLVGMYIYDEWDARRKRKQRQKETQAPAVQEPTQPAEIVPQPEDPKVSALRSAARQSLQINLLALEAQRQMAEIARLHRTDTTIRRNPQSDPYYRRAEWTQDGEDWRQGRF